MHQSLLACFLSAHFFLSHVLQNPLPREWYYPQWAAASYTSYQPRHSSPDMYTGQPDKDNSELRHFSWWIQFVTRWQLKLTSTIWLFDSLVIARQLDPFNERFLSVLGTKFPEASHRSTLQASSSEDQDSLISFLLSCFLQSLFVTNRTVILNNFEVGSIKKTGLNIEHRDFHVLGQLTL